MKTGHFILLSLFFIFALSAQNKTELDLNLMKLDRNWIFKQDSSLLRPSPLNESKPQISNSIPRLRFSDIRLSATSNFNEPLFRSDVLTLKMPKFIPDFDYTRNTYSVIPLNDNMWITTARINSNYIGLGGLSSAGAQYNWRINDFVTYSGGVTFSKFNIYNNFDNNLNLNSNLRFELSDRFFFNAFGNLSTPASKNTALFRSLNYSMFPQNNFGGSFEFKVTDKWGVATGAEREFDPFKGKWVTRPFIMPVFYSK